MKYGLIGEKLAHSYSKMIQEMLLDHYTYELKEVAKEDIDTFMKHKDFCAINVTIPYKQVVIPYLDEIETRAKEIGAINTIVHKDDKLIGYNTDYLGFIYTLKKHHVFIKDKKVLVLGNGGASKAVQVALEAEDAKEIIVVSRSGKEGTVSYETAYDKHQDADVIINTTPVGMYPHMDDWVLDLASFTNCTTCIDLIYNPLRTSLLLHAQALGMKTINGLEMLVAQAKYALELFKGITIEDDKIDVIYKRLLLHQSNLVFVGMPGAGKSVVSKLVSKELHKEFIDIDEAIEKITKLPITTYFKQYGEPAFRKVESDVCKQISGNTNMVISCGGGIVKDDQNIFYLKHNGLILYMERNTELLVSDDTRPLSSSKNAIMRLYKERECLYRQSQDITITNNTSLEEAVLQACKIYKENITKFNS